MIAGCSVLLLSSLSGKRPAGIGEIVHCLLGVTEIISCEMLPSSLSSLSGIGEIVHCLLGVTEFISCELLPSSLSSDRELSSRASCCQDHCQICHKLFQELSAGTVTTDLQNTFLLIQL